MAERREGEEQLIIIQGKEKVRTMASLWKVINARPPPPNLLVYKLKQRLEPGKSTKRLAVFITILIITGLEGSCHLGHIPT